MSGSFDEIDSKWSALVVDSTWITRPCPGCLSSESKLLFQKKKVPFLECIVCKTVYMNPIPPADLLRSLYNDLGGYFTDERKVELDFDPNRYQRELSAIPANTKGGLLLDVGCATGSFLQCALNAGFKVRGIDISRPSIDFANKKIGQDVAIADDFLEQPFDADSFDVVTLWVTLEHLSDADSVVRESQRVLKPGGMFCVSVPNGRGVSMRVLEQRWSQVDIDHLNYFSPAGLARLCERNGFQVLRNQTRSFNPIRFWRDWRGISAALDDQPGDHSRYLLEEQKLNTELRRNPGVRLVEGTLDLVWNVLRTGDLLIMTARKV